MLAAPLRREYGGLGLGTEPGNTLALLLLLKQLGRGNLAVGRVYEGHVNAVQLIDVFGTPQQREACAGDVRDGHKLFAIWNTEADDGVTLTPLPEGGDNGRGGESRSYGLAGAKTFASGAGYVERPLVTATLADGGVQLCLVPLDRVRAGVDRSWWRPLGMRATASYRVDFSGSELGPDGLIGSAGDYKRQPWFTGGAVRFAAVQLGGAEALLEAAGRYLRDLDRTADPYQQARAGEMAVAIESGKLWLRGAADVLDRSAVAFRRGPARADEDEDEDAEGVVVYANMTRTAIERACLEVLDRAERSVGARGLLRPAPFERLIRDLRLYLRQPAPDAALASVGQQALSAR